MPLKPILTEEEQNDVCELYQNNQVNQTDLATMFLVSRRTIQNTLIRRGLLHYKSRKPRKVTDEEEEILHQVKKRGLSPDALRKTLDAPALTRSNVELFLSRMDHKELAELSYTVGLVKLGQVRKTKEVAANEESAEGVANE